MKLIKKQMIANAASNVAKNLFSSSCVWTNHSIVKTIDRKRMLAKTVSRQIAQQSILASFVTAIKTITQKRMAEHSPGLHGSWLFWPAPAYGHCFLPCWSSATLMTSLIVSFPGWKLLWQGAASTPCPRCWKSFRQKRYQNWNYKLSLVTFYLINYKLYI